MKKPTKNIEKHIAVFLNGKSCGKTLNLLCLAGLLIESRVNFQILEGDLSTRGISNFYDQLYDYDVTDTAEVSRLLADVRANELLLYLLDSPAANQETILEIFESIASTAYYEETGIKLVFMVPVNDHIDSFIQAYIIVRTLEECDCRIVLILNHFPTDITGKYKTSDLKPVVDRLIKLGKAKVISVPRCKNLTALSRMQKEGLDPVRIQTVLCDIMEPFEKTELARWYSEVATQFRLVMDFLLPPGIELPSDETNEQPHPKLKIDCASLKRGRSRMPAPGGQKSVPSKSDET